MQKTRPNVNYTKDWADQLSPFPGLVWSERGFTLVVAVKNYFSIVTNNQPDDPKASLLLTSVRRQYFTIKLIFCSKAPLQNPTLPIWGKQSFCLKWSKRVQMGPKGVPNGQKHLGRPFWSLLDSFGPLWRKTHQQDDSPDK